MKLLRERTSDIASGKPRAPCDIVFMGADNARELARHEKLEHEVAATEEKVAKALFGKRPYAETLIAEVNGEPAGFALFFHNFSTFLAQPGIYLEDLFVKPEQRSHGVGRALLER